MKQLYEKTDVDRILQEQINKHGGTENFMREHPELTNKDVDEALVHGRYTPNLLFSINLRVVPAYDRILE